MHADAEDGVDPPQPLQDGKLGCSGGRGQDRAADEVGPSGERDQFRGSGAGPRARRGPEAAFGPPAELLAADLGVVPDVDGESRVAQERRGSEHRDVLGGRCAQLGDEVAPGLRVEGALGLHADDGLLGAGRADADQCAAADQRMGVEDALAEHGVQVVPGGAHALRRSSAEPQPTVAVEVAEVPGAVPEAGRGSVGRLEARAGRVLVRLLGHLVEGVGLRGGVVAGADGVSGHEDLPDAPGLRVRVGPGGEGPHRAVGDGLDPQEGAGYGPADAGSGAQRGPAGGFGQDLLGLDRGDREDFGGPVGDVDPRLLVQDVPQRGDHGGRHGRPAGHHAVQVGQGVRVGLEMVREAAQQGGRGEHRADGETFQRVDEQAGIGVRDLRRGERGEDDRGTVDQVEHAVEGHGDQGDVVPGASVRVLDLVGDRERHPVGVLDSLGGAGGSRGEADHQQVVPADGGGRGARARGGPQAREGVAAPQPVAAQRDRDPYGLEGTTPQDAHQVGERRAYEGLGAHGPVAVEHAAQPHAGVDDDGDGADPEEGEDQGEQLGSGRGHQHRPGSPADPRVGQSVGESLDLLLQLPVVQGVVAGAAVGFAAAVGVDDGRLVREGAGVVFQAGGEARGGAGRRGPGGGASLARGGHRITGLRVGSSRRPRWDRRRP